MTDSRSSASVVAVDPEKAARERDAAARALLRDDPLQTRTQYMTSGVELTIPFTLKVVVESDALERTKEIVDDILRSAWQLADTTINNFNPNSEVSLLCMLPVGQKHAMSDSLTRVMECCQAVFALTGGSFDPAIAPVADVMRANITGKSTISEEHLRKLMSLCTLPKSFKIDIKEGIILRMHEHARLDLGGVGKGYIVDYVVEKLKAAGLENVFFNWGGDCRGNGTNARNAPWMVGIIRPPSLEQLQNPPQDPPFIRVVSLCDEALATSGDYENLTKGTDNQLYTTIFDWNKESFIIPSQKELAQVSVKNTSAMYADALATACMIKRDITKVRLMLERWRYLHHSVTDYTTYTREGERVARMFDIAKERPEDRKKRLSGSLPARVVVVGGGLAGQSAAIEAAGTGSQVVLLEKESKLGGNSAKATSGINAWGTRAQAMQSIHDGGKYFERDTHKSGLGGNTDPGLVKMLSLKSADAIRWLTSLGVQLSVLSQLGGHSRKRTHRAPDKADGTPVPIGYTIMRTLEHHIRTNLSERVTIIERATVTGLLHKRFLRDDGVELVRVNGVEVTHADGTKASIMADAVILATGGFSNDKTPNSLLGEYAPHLAGFPTTNGPWATGDGVKLARALGVKLVDMDRVQLHPTGLIDPKDPANPTKYLGPEALRGSGGILLNKRGERFVNELDLRSVVSSAIIAQGDEYPGSGGSMFAYCVLNNASRTLFGVNSHGFYWKRLGLFVEAETVEDLARLIECPLENLRQTLGDYERLSTAKQICPNTRKAVYPCVVGAQGPFYVAFVTPSVHYTMGGCLISPSAEMQIEESKNSVFGQRRPILGLFGAGEVTGGVHGSNRLGGNSLLECVVFGRIAGDRAGHILYENFTELCYERWSKVTLRKVEKDNNGFRYFEFNLPSSLQSSGLSALQKVHFRAFGKESSINAFTPLSLPGEEGVIRVMWAPLPGVECPEWLCLLQPGDAAEARAGEALNNKHLSLFNATRRAVIATPHGAASMIQIIRATLERPNDDMKVHLIYIADSFSMCPYKKQLEAVGRKHPHRFTFAFVLEDPPAQWTGGVDYKDELASSEFFEKTESIFLCGDAKVMVPIRNILLEMGHRDEMIAVIQ